MTFTPLVSVIIIFYNPGGFLKEAIESVIAQSYPYWELLLVDDGSTDGSSETARSYAALHPDQIFYHAHEGGRNRGKVASRNQGIRRSKGDLIAFLDADDIWLPDKLREQTALLEAFPEAGMLYGDTLYWFSWTKKPGDERRDFFPNLGVTPKQLIAPPALIPLYLRGRAAVPCTCSILVRRGVVDAVGGFEEGVPGIKDYYEDQAFYAKICLRYPVVAVNACWDRYRQRSIAPKVVLSAITAQERKARVHFLNWLENYCEQQGVEDSEIRQALIVERWLASKPGWLPDSNWVSSSVRWIKKWILRLEQRLFPASVCRRLWAGLRKRRGC
jgi:glycosyltransferase involved in cell wall biosynthesis